MSSFNKRLTVVWIVVLLFIGAAVGLTISSRFDLINTGSAIDRPSLKVSPALTELSNALADVAAAVTPSVVNISTTKTVKQENPINPFLEDPFFRRFFGEPNGGGGRYREFKERSLGSGVIVSPDGYIVTNNHVVDGASDIKVVLSDKNEYKGKVIGSDPRSDVAVIKIDAKKLPTIAWGDSDGLRAGEMVMAVGSPFGLSQSVTTGIISAVGRANVGIADYEDFIQTDAAINPGNSGGALINMKGQLVGINTAIFSRSGGYQGIGFAVPVKMVKQVMDSLIKTGKVVRGWLGVSVQDVSPQLARQFGVEIAEGALVGEVVNGSPADKAGMKRGDVIVGFDGRKVDDSGHLRNMAASTPVGSRVKVDIVRDKSRMTVVVEIGEQPKDAQASQDGPETPETSSALTGVTVQDLTPELIDRLGLDKDVAGVVVITVEQASAADESGLARGDVILSINKKQVKNTKSYNAIVSKLKKEEPVLLLINRQGSVLWMSIGPAD
jgi:serine protease Do